LTLRPRIILAGVGACFLAAALAPAGPARAQDRYATLLCHQFWGTPEVRAKLRLDCDCVGRYLEKIKADPIDIEVHFRLFASVYTGKVTEEADALRSKFGAERYQAALDQSRGFLSGIMARGGCRLEPS